MKQFFAILIAGILMLGSANAIVTKESAAAAIREYDPSTENAVNLSIEYTRAMRGAFVTAIESMESDTSVTASYWYLTDDDTYFLGKGDRNWSWGLIDSRPQVIYNSYGPSNDRNCRACAIINNKPVEIENAGAVTGFTYTKGNALIGIKDISADSCAFLKVDTTDPDHPILKQIKAKELTIDAFLAYNGAKDCVDLITTAGYRIDSCLYWDQSAFALNFTKDDNKYHAFIFMIDGKLETEGGWWGDDIGLHRDFAVPCLDLDMELIETK